MKKLVAIILLLITPHFAQAQTLEHSLAFLLSGGSLDLSDVTVVDENTISFSKILNVPSEESGWGRSLKVIDRSKCVVRIDTATDYIGANGVVTRAGYYEFMFDNIILDETAESTNLNGSRKFRFVGEEPITCRNYKEFDFGHKDCDVISKTFDIFVQAQSVDRWLKAINFVYSKYCHAAKRKSAF